MTWWSGRRVAVTGGSGFLGGHVLAALRHAGSDSVFAPRGAEFDLTRQSDVRAFYERGRPQIVLHLAGKVGGIGATSQHPSDYFYVNAVMGIEMLEQARRHGVEKFVQVGTVCSYPQEASIPFDEGQIWNGFPEQSNAAYGLAKRALLAQAQAARAQYGFNAIYLLLANLYGPGDNFDPDKSHVIPALIRKCIDASESGSDTVTLWGSGNASREFLYVEDAARAIVMAAERYNEGEPVNVGTAREVTIRELAPIIAHASSFEGQFTWDTSKPDGQPRRKLKVDRALATFGFQSSVTLEAGIHETVAWYRRERVRNGSRLQP